jgi:hypothetical protein
MEDDMRRIVLNPKRVGALKRIYNEMVVIAKENPCDHSVGICCCSQIADIEVLEEIITGKKAAQTQKGLCYGKV